MKGILCLLAFCWCSCLHAEDTLHDVLHQLDQTVKHKEQYTAVRKERIRNLQQKLVQAKTIEERFWLSHDLFLQLWTFNTDSAFYYVEQERTLAERSGNRLWKNIALLDRADTYSQTGMYYMAMDQLENIDHAYLSSADSMRYFGVFSHIYELMADYAPLTEDQEAFTKLKLAYRDSVVSLSPGDTLQYYFTEADKIIASGEQLEELAAFMKSVSDTCQQALGTKAVAEYLLAMIYHRTGDQEAVKLHLAKSAIADIQNAQRDYISLRRLAEMLYAEGDLDRAYTYLECSLMDAAAANLRLRTIEINQGFPMVNAAYQKYYATRKRQIITALIVAVASALLAILGIVALRRQNQKLRLTRKMLEEANGNLQALNIEQKKLNEELRLTNATKDVYIARYLTLCSEYIEKLEEQKKRLLKVGKERNMDSLLTAIKNSVQVDQEVKDFYHNFDVSFLSLFPDFIEDFNRLLRPECQLQPKSNGGLSTELRIFALIRLGIADSEKIALFLRCSLSTVYNYRVKNRNAAVVDRHQFEEAILKIGQ
ncbi:MAG: hypothetical protein HUK02_06780 [Bacteroidaceae bacterium]|nr:hypothetical protein [Bacteroidaceae bacterium]